MRLEHALREIPGADGAKGICIPDALLLWMTGGWEPSTCINSLPEFLDFVLFGVWTILVEDAKFGLALPHPLRKRVKELFNQHSYIHVGSGHNTRAGACATKRARETHVFGFAQNQLNLTLPHCPVGFAAFIGFWSFVCWASWVRNHRETGPTWVSLSLHGIP